MKKATKKKLTGKQIISKTGKFLKEFATPEIELGLYTATLKVFGKKYTAAGASVVDALLNLKGVGKLAGGCVLTITHGEVTREKIINARILWGLFNGSQTMKDIAIKNASLIYGDL